MCVLSIHYNLILILLLYPQFIETMGLQNLHLVGCSLGALVSATYAAMYPHSVKSAVLMCPPGVCVCACAWGGREGEGLLFPVADKNSSCM